MTCKNCYHYDVCAVKSKMHLSNRHIKGKSIDTDFRDDVEIVCKHFKDKSHIVELPCKVGNTVFLPNMTDFGTIEHYEITEFVYDGKRLYFVVDDEDKETHLIENIGKTVLLTEEEAKAKMDEEA